MAMTIIECPSCHHVHKKNAYCDTCNREREWEVGYGMLKCESCRYGWESRTCQSCGHKIPMIEDFAKFYPDYVEFEGTLPAIIDGFLERQRYKTALEILEVDWIKYEVPTGYSLESKRDEASQIRRRYLIFALLAGVVLGGGWLGAASDPQGAGFFFLVGAFGGASLAALFVYTKGGQWGNERGKWIDRGVILLMSAVGSILFVIVVFLVIGWFVVSILSGG